MIQSSLLVVLEERNLGSPSSYVVYGTGLLDGRWTMDGERRKMEKKTTPEAFGCLGLLPVVVVVVGVQAIYLIVNYRFDLIQLHLIIAASR